VPFFHAFVQTEHLTQRHEILSTNITDSRLSYGKNPKCLSHLGLDRYRDVTPGRTDKQTYGQIIKVAAMRVTLTNYESSLHDQANIEQS